MRRLDLVCKQIRLTVIIAGRRNRSDFREKNCFGRKLQQVLWIAKSSPVYFF